MFIRKIRSISRVLLFVFTLVFFSISASAETLKVLTLNTWLLEIRVGGGSLDLPKGLGFSFPYLSKPVGQDIALRLAQMPRIIAETGADLIALQEVWQEDYAVFLINALKPIYPYSERRSDRTWSEFGQGRGLIIRNGLVILSRYPIRKQDSGEMDSVNFSTITRGDERFALKGAIRVTIDLPRSDSSTTTSLDFFNTHLGAMDFNVENGQWEPTHLSALETQARELTRFIDTTKRNSLQIVAGDFNLHPHQISSGPTDEISYGSETTKIYGLMVGSQDGGLGMQDSWIAASDGSPEYSYTPENPYVSGGLFSTDPKGRLDQIFYSSTAEKPLIPTKTTIVFDQPTVESIDGRKVHLSDHFGVLSEFSY